MPIASISPIHETYIMLFTTPPKMRLAPTTLDFAPDAICDAWKALRGLLAMFFEKLGLETNCNNYHYIFFISKHVNYIR